MVIFNFLVFLVTALCFLQDSYAVDTNGKGDSILGHVDQRKVSMIPSQATKDVIVEAFFEGSDGKIDIVQTSSGFPFKNNMILTNAHSVLLDGNKERAKFLRVSYFDEKGEKQEIETDNFLENKEYVLCHKNNREDCFQYDFSVIQTDSVFKKHFKLKKIGNDEIGMANISGFTQCYGSALDEKNRCDFKKAEKNPPLLLKHHGEFNSYQRQIFHKIDTTNGQSGSCIRPQNDDSSCIGIHSTGGPNLNFGASFNRENMIRIEQMYKELNGEKK